MRRSMLFLSLLCATSMAHAGDKPLYADAPAWVNPAPAIDPAKLGAGAPMLIRLDSQQRLEDGQTWAYIDTATRAASAQALDAIGTIKLDWQPAHGDLIVHGVEIIRGGERIDLVKGGEPLSVLRREQSLDERILDGVLTATMPVEGLRVGDILHLTFSITSKDPTLRGNVQTVAPLLFDPFRVDFARVRLLWPEGSDIKWKAYADGMEAKPVAAGGYKELNVALPLAKQPEIPADAPMRFQKIPMMEATSFDSWAEVASVMAPLYETAGLIAVGSPLAEEVARIEAASADPLERAALALQLVQSKVRYQLMGMEGGNYVPQTPAETWSLRYGDCKAKTLLLLALLHEMEIEAEPVLASVQLGGLLPSRLPSAAAFDHVLVRAIIAGKELWLDGTGSGARLADIGDTPALGHVLPLRPEGAELMPVAMRTSARADMMIDLELDQSAGVNLPAPFKASVVLRGPVAEMLRMTAAQGSEEDIEGFANRIVSQGISDGALVSHQLTFDEEAGTATLDATGIAYPSWDKEKERWGTRLDDAEDSIAFSPDRARPAWRDLPVAAGAPSNLAIRTRIRMPGKGEGFTVQGGDTLAEQLGSNRIDRTVVRSGEWLTIDSRLANIGGEVPASEIADVRRRITRLKATPLRLIAPHGYPGFPQLVEQGKRAKAFDAIQAAYDKRVADKPDESMVYTDRAWFLERIFERKKALKDLDRALEIEPNVGTYLSRAALHAALGDKAMAVADAEAALELDPSSDNALGQLANYRADNDDREGALAMIQERIDAGGDNLAEFHTMKAQMEAEGGNAEAAITTIDAAVADDPGNATLLNGRCWLKGTNNVALETALKDCTKAIELSDYPAQALDSRAMVYLRMDRLEDARADLDAALTHAPDLAASLFLRGIIRKRTGDVEGGDADLQAARLMAPRIDEKYGKWGITAD